MSGATSSSDGDYYSYSLCHVLSFRLHIYFSKCLCFGLRQEGPPLNSCLQIWTIISFPFQLPIRSWHVPDEVAGGVTAGYAGPWAKPMDSWIPTEYTPALAHSKPTGCPMTNWHGSALSTRHVRESFFLFVIFISDFPFVFSFFIIFEKRGSTINVVALSC